MSAAGSPTRGGSGNGDPPKRYTCEPTDGFNDCWAEIERAYPRVVDIGLRAQIEACARLLPAHLYAKPIGDKGWMFATEEGFGVPEIYVYFRFEQRHVTLEVAVPDACEEAENT